jgi:predicted nucleic acid-binding Zn ribbon protein
MASYSVGEALKLLLEKSKWKPKVHELRMQQEWEQIVGKTISKYTRNVVLNGTSLTVYTDVAALKQELHFGKQQLIDRINEYFQEKVVAEVVVK